MKKAIYTNKALNETYVLIGVRDLAHAWNLADFAASRNGWNVIDVRVKIETI